MPTYDYACATCGEMEIFQSMKDDALTVCPQCGSKRFSKQVSAGAGVIFKGSGFWETDYKRGSDYRKAAEGDAAPAAKTEPKSETKTTASNPSTESGSAA